MIFYLSIKHTYFTHIFINILHIDILRVMIMSILFFCIFDYKYSYTSLTLKVCDEHLYTLSSLRNLLIDRHGFIQFISQWYNGTSRSGSIYGFFLFCIWVCFWSWDYKYRHNKYYQVFTFVDFTTSWYFIQYRYFTL